MKVQVYHKAHDRNYDFSAKAENVAKGEYKEVAIVYSNKTDVMAALEDAYYHTNNIDSSWAEDATEKSYVDAHVDSARSSSVGDKFVINGVEYVVAPCGFEKVA